VADAATALPIGNPMAAETKVGPLVSAEHRDKVESYLRLCEEEGGKILFGGRRPPDPDLSDGYYLEPTLLTGLANGSRCPQEEIFGPVLVASAFDDEAQAVQWANDTPYGLAGMVWTTNLKRAHGVAGAIRSGLVWVNCFFVRDLRAPFGGAKRSGLGREGGYHSRDFFTEAKTVTIAALKLSDPYSYADPRKFYYATYVADAADRYDAFAKTLKYLEDRKLFTKLPEEWQLLFSTFVLPLRHYELAGQLISSNASRFAWGTTVEQAASFAGFDRIGNAQMLSLIGLAIGAGTSDPLTEAKKNWLCSAPSRACGDWSRTSERYRTLWSPVSPNREAARDRSTYAVTPTASKWVEGRARSSQQPTPMRPSPAVGELA
jgi:hypothetical protein